MSLKIVPKFTEEDKRTLEFVGKPLFIQKVLWSHKFAKLRIGDKATIKQNGTSLKVKLIKKKSLLNGKYFGLMFELS